MLLELIWSAHLVISILVVKSVKLPDQILGFLGDNPCSMGLFTAKNYAQNQQIILIFGGLKLFNSNETHSEQL